MTLGIHAQQHAVSRVADIDEAVTVDIDHADVAARIGHVVIQRNVVAGGIDMVVAGDMIGAQ